MALASKVQNQIIYSNLQTMIHTTIQLVHQATRSTVTKRSLQTIEKTVKKYFLLSAISIVGLAGCGGGANDTPPNASTPNASTVIGRIADGYIRGALVFWDCNQSKTFDAGELYTISKAGGQYEIAVQPSSSCLLSAYVPSSAVDEDTNQPVSSAMFMRALSNKPNFISPLTTIVALNAISESDLKSKFGPGSTLNIGDDYIQAGTAGVSHHNVAKYIAAGLQSNHSSILDAAGAAEDKLRGILQIIPGSAFVSSQPIPQSALNNFLAGLPKEDDEIALTSNSLRFHINQAKFKDLSPTQQGHVAHAFKIYAENSDRVGRGENLRWSNLSSDLRVDLKKRFTTPTFAEPEDAAELVKKRDAFLSGERDLINAAKSKFDRELSAKLIDGAINSSFIYFDGWISLAAPSVIKKASSVLVSPQKSSKIRRLPSIIKNVQTGLGCIGADLALLNSLLFELETGQFVEIGKVWGLVECIMGELQSGKTKQLLQSINIALKSGGVITASVQSQLETVIASSELVLVLLDIVGIDDVPGASNGIGVVKILLGIAKAAKLAADMGNTNDASQLAFEQTLSHIDLRVKEHLETYSREVFDLRLNPYFERVRPYTVEVSTSSAIPYETEVRASLTVSVQERFVPQVQWFFGDGNRATGVNAKHIYTKPGKYTLTSYALGATELAIKVHEATIEVACAGDTVFSGAEGCIKTAPIASTVPHTGISANQCNQAGSDILVACDSSQALALNGQQDGHRTESNTMSYSNVANFPITSCVKDDVTGLIWEGKEASGPRAGSNKYSNFDSNAGTVEQINAASNSVNYLNYVNSIALCGFSDWRIPSATELQTIVDYGSTAPSIRTAWFPHMPQPVVAGDRTTFFITSSRYVANSDLSWVVDFLDGSVDGWYRSFDQPIRLVRGEW